MNNIFNNKDPLYIQIAQYFMFKIVNGELIPGERIPSRRKLASILGVNVNTVQKALSELERKGLIVNEFGKPSYVQKDLLKIKEVRKILINEALNSLLTELEPLNVKYDELVTIIKEKYNNNAKSSRIIKKSTSSSKKNTGFYTR